MSEGVLVVRPLEIEELAVAAERLPLNRLEQPGGEYLVAWEGSEPVGHAHLDWRSDPPELQDVFVREPLRRRGIGAALCAVAERHVVKRGGRRIGLEVSEQDPAARALYEKLGYHQTDDPPRRVRGRIDARSFRETLVEVATSRSGRLVSAMCRVLPGRRRGRDVIAAHVS
jgi:ribosomal protein S18 acetylase RimI-like enzyme